MSVIHGARREIQRLRRKLVEYERDFRAGAPPLDEDGMPVWDGCEPLTVESYMKAMGFDPDEELTDEEADARVRLSPPYRDLFERLERDATEEVGT